MEEVKSSASWDNLRRSNYEAKAGDIIPVPLGILNPVYGPDFKVGQVIELRPIISANIGGYKAKYLGDNNWIKL